jgi:hypothetical protein
MSPITRIKSFVRGVHVPHPHFGRNRAVLWVQRHYSDQSVRVTAAIVLAIAFLLLAIWLSAGSSGETASYEPFLYYPRP